MILNQSMNALIKHILTSLLLGLCIMPCAAVAENQNDMLNEALSRYENLNYVNDLYAQPLKPAKRMAPVVVGNTPNSVSTAQSHQKTAPIYSFEQSSSNLDLWKKMRSRFSMSDNIAPDTVAQFERYYQNRPDYFGRIVLRGSPYLFHILNETEKRGMPGEIALLPMIESAFVTQAKSGAGASGIWQFMPKTGKAYGLKQNHWYDGRNDIYAATDAALDYLQQLYRMFGDWALALAAYNAGEGRVAKAQRKAIEKGIEPIYENLDLPRETREYVPKLLAVRNLVRNPSSFDMTLKKIDNQAYFEVVQIDQPMDMEVIADLADISMDELYRLNPGHRVPVWVPQPGRKLLLPKKSVATFTATICTGSSQSISSI